MHRPLIPPLLLTALLACTSGHAATIASGQKLPPLRIDELGECVIRDGETAFEPWQSDQLLGKVQVIEYLAARMGADKIQQPLYAAIKAAGLPQEHLTFAKLVNSDDALFGTGKLVAAEVGKGKKERPGETLVVDARGVGLKSWELRPNGSAVAIVKADGTVLFFKEGALSDAEIERVVTLLRQQLP